MLTPTTPTISVVIPTYNSTKTVLDTIASVQAQTFDDIEIIVIDDGSTDDLQSCLAPILADARVKVYRYANGGLPVARNRGIARSTGEYIAFVDADDLWTPNKLEKQLKALQDNPRAGLAYSWTYFMEEDGQRYHTDRPIWFQGDVLKDLLMWNFLCHGSNPLIRRSVIAAVGDFDPSLPSAEDWDYWLRIATGWEFALVPEPQIYYRQSGGAMSAKVEVMEAAQLEVLDRAFQRAPATLQPYRRPGMAKIYQYSAQLYLIHGKTLQTRKLVYQKLGKTIQLNPRLLFDRKTQKLLTKALLVSVVPWQTAKRLLRRFSKGKAQVVQ
ncbi:glycosyltransferase [filamentous cyanobacterium LEGE 11480]|uniref:Glycosyltransferase n=1 Tax=Romeriopsis navalis LEGE 11480 TaxID=2777977 RepID=A0A928VR19_9CYAN|nr:glycosyltransferase [Romeriopsis navalis]MBE9030967.1 glycosyltransferase [Romeriopsis navalis LEGE 11480]